MYVLKECTNYLHRAFIFFFKFYSFISNSDPNRVKNFSLKTSHILFYFWDFRCLLYSASDTSDDINALSYSIKPILPGWWSLKFRSPVLHHPSTLLQMIYQVWGSRSPIIAMLFNFSCLLTSGKCIYILCDEEYYFLVLSCISIDKHSKYLKNTLMKKVNDWIFE